MASRRPCQTRATNHCRGSNPLETAAFQGALQVPEGRSHFEETLTSPLIFRPSSPMHACPIAIVTPSTRANRAAAGRWGHDANPSRASGAGRAELLGTCHRQPGTDRRSCRPSAASACAPGGRRWHNSLSCAPALTAHIRLQHHAHLAPTAAQHAATCSVWPPPLPPAPVWPLRPHFSAPQQRWPRRGRAWRSSRAAHYGLQAAGSPSACPWHAGSSERSACVQRPRRRSSSRRQRPRRLRRRRRRAGLPAAGSRACSAGGRARRRPWLRRRGPPAAPPTRCAVVHVESSGAAR